MGALTHKEREGLQEVFLSIQSQNKHNYSQKLKMALKVLVNRVKKFFYAKIIKKEDNLDV